MTRLPIHLSAAMSAALAFVAATALAGEVSFSVTEPSGVQRDNWPVTSGVPMARGALADGEAAAMFAPDGRELPLQTEVLSRWPDGSIRWLLLDFSVSLAKHEKREFLLRYGPNVRRTAVTNPIAISEQPDGIELRSGKLRLVLSARHFRLLDAVWLDRNQDGQFSDDERLTSATGAGVVLSTPDGRQFRADLSDADMTVEQVGPLRACVRVTGQHTSEDGTMFRYIIRIHVYRGQPFLKLHYTFVNDHKAELMTEIESLELRFAKSTSQETQAVLAGKPSRPARLVQVDDQSYEIDGQPAGKRAPGWAALYGNHGGLAVGVREFWQNWPKSLEAGRNQLRVGICPQFPEGRYDNKPIKEEAKLYYYLRDGVYRFKIGVSRTHELWVQFFDGQPRVKALSAFFRTAEEPLLARLNPEYLSATGASGTFPPADRHRYMRYDAWLDSLFRLHLDDLEHVREYGMLNFGDWYNVNWDSWGNLEYDTARCFFVQYLRSGDRRYFDRASQAARHYLDVDVVHEVNQQLHDFGGSANIQPGHVWLHQVGHTGGYYGRYEDGKYHDEAPLIMKGPYQVGMYNYGHQWIGGVFDHYLLTGDRHALEVATMTSDTIAANCPTRYTDHIRDLGWPLNLVIAAYEATGDKKYLDAATRQWELLKKHFDPDRGFQVMLAYGHCSAASEAKRCRGQNAYMLGLTLSGLARYHRITQDPAALEGLTAGIEQLIRECWSAEHKSFYLTSCTHNRSNPPPALCSVTALAAEAFAYEAKATGNEEHRRIFQEAFRTMVDAGLQSVARGDQQGQTGYASMMFHFTPFALSALEDPPAATPEEAAR